jgi:2-polyprenyl-6-methoxyphenol hydroxylase-like FAD-dependent oxidoreductase
MWDAIIVGARCAGAPLAMLLARSGQKVLLIDRAGFPSDTLSTHFMWTPAVAFLARWGLLARLLETGCPPIRSVLVDTGDVHIRSAPSSVDGVDIMLCPRRTVIDALLVEAAREVGAEVMEGVTVRDVIWSDDRVVGVIAKDSNGVEVEFRGSLVVGADGLNSRIARAVVTPYRLHRPPVTFSFYAYWEGVPLEWFGSHRREGRLILEFPTHDHQTCIYVGWPRDQYDTVRGNVEANYLASIDLVPELAERTRGGRRVTRIRGSNNLPNYYREPAGPGWALVGDAAYHKDPTTGMGMGDAFLGAELLAAAIDAERKGGACGPTRGLATYGDRLESRTRHVLDWTLVAANYRNRAGLTEFYLGIAENPTGARRLMDVLSGQVHFTEVFNQENIERVSAIGHALTQRASAN